MAGRSGDERGRRPGCRPRGAEYRPAVDEPVSPADDDVADRAVLDRPSAGSVPPPPWPRPRSRRRPPGPRCGRPRPRSSTTSGVPSSARVPPPGRRPGAVAARLAGRPVAARGAVPPGAPSGRTAHHPMVPPVRVDDRGPTAWRCGTSSRRPRRGWRGTSRCRHPGRERGQPVLRRTTQRRYRDEDDADDVLARVLGQS